ncbi:MAG TPA: cobalamin-dependent protein [Dehalococcoidia bacterium]|jgi:methanogenic corrinoid protein MtbC1|nr:cobalamin-dependent protein [Dehalococcoidia bacterium]
MSEELALAIVDLDREKVLNLVESRSKKGESPLQILEECRQGMTIVGERYQKGEFFLLELMLSGEIFKGVMAILEPQLAKERPPKPLGRIVLATLKGDIHNLGKDLFGSLVKIQGFEVYDLGVDVAPALVVDKVKEVKPDFVGFSALITSTFDSMKQASEMLEKAGLRKRFKLMVGGGITTPMVKDYIGADFQTRDAMEGVAYCMKSIGGQ